MKSVCVKMISLCSWAMQSTTEHLVRTSARLAWWESTDCRCLWCSPMVP